MIDNQKCIDVCNQLLRGELSAVETYSQAMEKFADEPAHLTLAGIRSDHQLSVSCLRQHLLDMGANPDDTSGAWGTFAQVVEGTAKVFGESPALAALKQGEEMGARDYRAALENEDVMTSVKDEIRKLLLPRIESHINTLDKDQVH